MSPTGSIDGSGALPPEAETPGAPAAGPPGGRIFSLEDRPAPGLYFSAWILGLAGALVGFVGLVSGGASGALLFVLGLALLGLGCAAGCGYQVLARADRRPDAYRGPSPVLLFAPIVPSTILIVVLLGALGIADARTPLGGLLVEVVTAGAYALFILAGVVRTRALRWSDMGWRPDAVAAARLPIDVLAAAALVAPVWFATQVGGGLLARALDVRLESPLPAPSTGSEAIATVLAAVLVAPIGEELFFRGFALTAWWRDLGAAAALRRSTLFFALIHILNVSAASAGTGLKLALLQFVVIVPIGYVLGWLFIRRGLLASIAGHMTFNAITIALLLAIPT